MCDPEVLNSMFCCELLAVSQIKHFSFGLRNIFKKG